LFGRQALNSSFAFSLSLSLSPPFSLSLSLPPLSHSLTHSLFLSHSVTPSFSLTHYIFLSHSLTLSLSHFIYLSPLPSCLNLNSTVSIYSVCLSVCLCLPDCVSIWLPVCLSACQPVWPSARLTIWESDHLHVWPPACLPACLPVFLSAWIFSKFSRAGMRTRDLFIIRLYHWTTVAPSMKGLFYFCLFRWNSTLKRTLPANSRLGLKWQTDNDSSLSK
jgi:hypothetical protein